MKGPAERVTSDAEIRASGIKQLKSWSPTSKHFVLKVTANSVTGRRFSKTPGRADSLHAFEADAAAPESAPADRTRAQRPEPIPHRTPPAEQQDRRLSD